jgi:hypothetical protein
MPFVTDTEVNEILFVITRFRGGRASELMDIFFLVEIQVHDAVAASQFYRGIFTSQDQLFGTVVPVPSAAGQHESVCTHDQ